MKFDFICILKQIYIVLRNLLFPSFCIYCKEPLKKGIICDNCLNKIQMTSDSECCNKCGLAKESELDYCWFCKKQHNFKKLRTIVKYNDNIRDIILSFKYHKRFDCGDFIIEEIIKFFPIEYSYIKFDFITCIPSHYLRFAIREYNHMAYITKSISKKLNIPYIQLVKKSKYTKSQTTFDYKKRKTNVKNSFKIICKDNLKDKNILLIEDVVTTGSTIEEFINALSVTKANIYVLSYADARHYTKSEVNNQ